MRTERIIGKCPYCGKETIEKVVDMILSSDPPQWTYHCTNPECDKVWYAHNDREALTPSDIHREETITQSSMAELGSITIDSPESLSVTGGKSGSYTVGTDSTVKSDDSFNIRYGWVCPKCGRVYSPNTSMCPYCGDSIVPTIGTTNPGSPSTPIYPFWNSPQCISSNTTKESKS